jgi:hypothetical protein
VVALFSFCNEEAEEDKKRIFQIWGVAHTPGTFLAAQERYPKEGRPNESSSRLRCPSSLNFRTRPSDSDMLKFLTLRVAVLA